MPVFPSYYNPQTDENDYRRNMMRVFRIEKNQDNNSDYTSNNTTPQSSVGKYEENLDTEILSFDEKITVLQNTLNEVDDDMNRYKSFYDSPEFTTAIPPATAAVGHVHDPNERYLSNNTAALMQRLHKLENLQPPIESKINRAEGLLSTIFNQYKAKISGKHLNRYKKDEWVKIQQTFNKLFDVVNTTTSTVDIYISCVINRSTLGGNHNFHFHNPPDNFAHRLKSTLTEFKDVFNSDKSRYSYNLGKF